MHFATTRPGEHGVEETPPAALLQLPADWFNILEEQGDAVAARRRYETLLERFFPAMEVRAREQGVEVLLACRETLWNAGLLAYGLVAAPATADDEPVFWQILVTLTKLPPISDEIDPGALLLRFLKDGFKNAHVEQFETALGFGAGFIAQTPVPPEQRPPRSPYAMGGTAGAISCPPEGGWSILVMGISYDARQAAQLGWLVGQIAGHSTLEAREEKAEKEKQPQQGGSTD